jgi:hypothetical protein
MPSDLLIPKTLTECKMALRKAWDLVRKLEWDAPSHRKNEHQDKLAKLRAQGDAKGIKNIKG